LSSAEFNFFETISGRVSDSKGNSAQSQLKQPTEADLGNKEKAKPYLSHALTQFVNLVCGEY
jgi:hypothetical protein